MLYIFYNTSVRPFLDASFSYDAIVHIYLHYTYYQVLEWKYLELTTLDPARQNCWSSFCLPRAGISSMHGRLLFISGKSP